MMADNMDKIITIGLVIIGLVSVWAVVTANHLFIG